MMFGRVCMKESMFCAFAANAMYIVSEDKHYKVLERIAFPRLFVVSLMQFVQKLRSQP